MTNLRAGAAAVGAQDFDSGPPFSIAARHVSRPHSHPVLGLWQPLACRVRRTACCGRLQQRSADWGPGRSAFSCAAACRCQLHLERRRRICLDVRVARRLALHAGRGRPAVRVCNASIAGHIAPDAVICCTLRAAAIRSALGGTAVIWAPSAAPVFCGGEPRRLPAVTGVRRCIAIVQAVVKGVPTSCCHAGCILGFRGPAPHSLKSMVSIIQVAVCIEPD